MTHTSLNRSPAAVLGLLVSEAILLTGCYILGAYWASIGDLELYLFYDEGLQQIVFVVIVIQLGLYLQLLYETLMPKSRLVLIQKICVVLGFAFLVQSFSTFVNWIPPLSKWTMVYGSLLTLLALPLWRITYAILIRKGLPEHRLLFLGCGLMVPETVSILNLNRGMGMEAVGYLAEDASDSLGLPRLGTFEDVDKIILALRPDRIITALQGEDHLPANCLLSLLMAGIQIEDASTLYEALTGRVSTRFLQPNRLICSSALDPSADNVALKTFYSLLVGAVVTLLALPFMALVALLVKLTSRGPILSRQKLVGLGGMPFTLYRFRTHRQDGTIGVIGYWLERLHLDGLPQWFNVLRGEMSIVGPRPVRPEFAAVLSRQLPCYNQRHSVRPGITDWASVRGSEKETMDSILHLDYDLYYIKNMSPALDAHIILRSLTASLAN